MDISLKTVIGAFLAVMCVVSFGTPVDPDREWYEFFRNGTHTFWVVSYGLWLIVFERFFDEPAPPADDSDENSPQN